MGFSLLSGAGPGVRARDAADGGLIYRELVTYVGFIPNHAPE